MGHGVSGGGKPSAPNYKIREEKLTKKIVLDEVVIHEVVREYVVPKVKFVEQEQIKLITHEAKQTKYNTVVVNTTKYNKVEKDTTKYIPKEEETIKYIPKEVEVERPVSVPKEYERPVIKEKIVELVSYSDVAAIKQLMEIVPSLVKEVRELKKHLDTLRDYKLVEEIIKAPKIEWIPTPTERIIWTDVKRERPKG